MNQTRDIFGRYAPTMNKTELDNYNKIEQRLREIEKQKKKQDNLSWHQIQLLYILVQHDYKKYYSIHDLPGFYHKKSFPRVSFKKAKNQHNIKYRSNFTRLVNKMVSQGFIIKYRVGKKLFIRITTEGLRKLRVHDENQHNII